MLELRGMDSQMARANDSDVLVVGGGVIGLACAHYLAEAGRTVRLIEQDRIGAGASHGNCGLVVVSYLLPLCVPGIVRKEIFGMLGIATAPATGKLVQEMICGETPHIDPAPFRVRQL